MSRCRHDMIELHPCGEPRHPTPGREWLIERCRDCGAIRIAEHECDRLQPESAEELRVVRALPWRGGGAG